MLLQQQLNQQDPLIGVLSDGRGYEELQTAIGPFARVLPTRLSIDRAARFDTLVALTQTVLEQARAWHEFWVWDNAGLSEAARARATFALAFDWYNWDRLPPADATSFTITQRDVCIDRSRLKLLGHREGDQLQAKIHYDPRCFAADDIHALAGALAALVGQVLDDPILPLERYHAMTPAERRQVLIEFNSAAAPYERERSVHRCFSETVVERQPDRPAVVYEGQQLSYAELNARANQLARAIRRHGVGRDTCVGLYLDRSLDTIVSILGVLKAGGPMCRSTHRIPSIVLLLCYATRRRRWC